MKFLDLRFRFAICNLRSKIFPALLFLFTTAGIYGLNFLPSNAASTDIYPEGLTFDVGDGSDGAITVSADANISSYGANDGNNVKVINATTFTLDATKTLTLNAQITIIRATGAVTINGTINGDALGGGGGAASGTYPAYASPAGEGWFTAPGVWSNLPGGNGGSGGGDASGGNGGGGGGGGGSARGTNAGACAGCYLGQGGPKSNWLDFFMTDSTLDTIMGQGGGTGQGANPTAGRAGGAGGAGLYIFADSITTGTNASITLDGANGTAGAGTSSGGGGGGGGGVVIMMAEDITIGGSGTKVTATGGTGGAAAGGGGAGGAGAAGWIVAIYLDTLSRTDFGDPTATTYQFIRSRLVRPPEIF